MKMLIYDPFSGISGDMHMGAMIDLGVPEDYILDSLEALGLSGWNVEFRREKKMGMSGTRAIVSTGEDLSGGGHESAGDHHHESAAHHHEDGDHHYESEAHHHGGGDHQNDDGHQHHHHESGGDHHHESTGHQHPHRGLEEIRQIVEESDLSERIKERSMRMFRLIAEAEAKVHGTTVEEVHFHEVGAMDSILDIVAAAAGIEYLAPDTIVSFPPQLGGGFVDCAHGRMPVPAPATVEILTGVPSKSGAVEKETTTPTGAAILKANVDEFIETSSYTVTKTGYGVGTRDLEIPNVLRAYLAETADKSASVDALMIECNIDDMSPELYDHVLSRLFEEGAKDAYITPVQMKKNRPGILLSVMTTPEKRETMRSILFCETSTAGLREYPVRQTMLERSFETVQTSYGEIRVKSYFYRGECVSKKPEYEEIKTLAERHGVSLREIYRNVERER